MLCSIIVLYAHAQEICWGYETQRFPNFIKELRIVVTAPYPARLELVIFSPLRNL
jgi:hypothetical protein